METRTDLKFIYHSIKSIYGSKNLLLQSQKKVFIYKFQQLRNIKRIENVSYICIVSTSHAETRILDETTSLLSCTIDSKIAARYILLRFVCVESRLYLGKLQN